MYNFTDSPICGTSNKVYNFTFRWGTTTPTRSFTRLSCRKVTEMWFDVMMSYRDIGR